MLPLLKIEVQHKIRLHLVENEVLKMIEHLPKTEIHPRANFLLNKELLWYHQPPRNKLPKETEGPLSQKPPDMKDSPPRIDHR